MRASRRHALRAAFDALCAAMGMTGQLHDAHVKPRVLIMVSKIGHCLNDLLFRYKSGLLPVEIPAIVSNHMDFYQLAASYNIPFHHLPLAAGADDTAKAAQEARILELLATHRIDLVVLARYMRILSPESLPRVAGPGDQYPSLVPAQFQGRAAVCAGAQPRRETDRRHGAFRHRRAR